MRFSLLKSALTAAMVLSSPLMVYADTDNAAAQTFQTGCLKAWMGRSEAIKDKVDYQNFGEKYCACAATQPLATASDVQQAAQICMSRIMLHDTMDSLEDDVGLAKTTSENITEYCHDRWNLIYPSMSEADKTATAAYCECANPKLFDLVKKSDSMTDKTYSNEIDGIAGACSGKVKADETTTKAPH